MRRFRFLAVLLILALLSSLVLTIAGAPPVEADGDIESEFDLGQGPRDGMTGIPFLTPDIPSAVAPSGSGEFELDGDLDDLEFELEIEAEGLLPNTPYDLSVSLRSGHGGLQAALNVVVVGTATTDDEGKLEFEIEDSPLDLAALFPAGADGPGWRVDFGIVDPGVWSPGNCDAALNPCRLVCAPFTSITPADLLDDDDD